MIGKYYVDGYAVVDGQKILYEYNGCAYHSCDRCKQVRINKNNEEERKQFFRTLPNTILVDISSCDWYKEKFEIDFETYRPEISPLLFQRTVAVNTLISHVRRGLVYGFMIVDLEKLKGADKWRQLNWPPLMQKSQILYDDLPPWMRDLFDASEFPKETIIQRMHAKNLLLHTSLLQFYMENGFYVKKVHRFFEYQGARCFGKVFETVYRARVEATQVANDENATFEDKAAAEMKATAVKLVSNSMYGSLLLVSQSFI